MVGLADGAILARSWDAGRAIVAPARENVGTGHGVLVLMQVVGLEARHGHAVGQELKLGAGLNPVGGASQGVQKMPFLLAKRGRASHPGRGQGQHGKTAHPPAAVFPIETVAAGRAGQTPTLGFEQKEGRRRLPAD